MCLPGNIKWSQQKIFTNSLIPDAVNMTKPPCFRLAVIFIKKEGVSQVLNMYQPAAYVPGAPCVRPFHKRGLASAEHVSTRSLRPWRPMRSPLPQRKGLTSTEHVRRPAVYVQDASCVRPFRSEYSITANAKSSVWQNIMSKGQYIGQWISSRQNSIDEFPTAV